MFASEETIDVKIKDVLDWKASSGLIQFILFIWSKMKCIPRNVYNSVHKN